MKTKLNISLLLLLQLRAAERARVMAIGGKDSKKERAS